MRINIPIPQVSKKNQRVQGALWKSIRAARSPLGVIKWIKENMTGDQLIPNWGGHKQEVWFSTNGQIKSSAIGYEALKQYLTDIYNFWLDDNGKPWKDDQHKRDNRILKILATESNDIKQASWPATLTEDEKIHNAEAKYKGRYNLLAEDYFNHIDQSAKIMTRKSKVHHDNAVPADEKPSLLTNTEFCCIAIYSSAQFTQMLGIARGHSRGNQFKIGKAQDLWFLAYATSGIKKLSKIATEWYDLFSRKHPEGVLPTDNVVVPPPPGHDKDNHAYLRRDMDCTSEMIEDLFFFSEHTVAEEGFIKTRDTKYFMDKGMMSTSYNTAGAEPYCENSNVSMLIQIDKREAGKYNAVPLEAISRLPMEKEILWAPETYFKIIAIRDNRKKENASKERAGWRNPTRDWSKSEKLWVYLEAPLRDTQPPNLKYRRSQIIKTLKKLNLLEYLVETIEWPNKKYTDKEIDDERKRIISQFLKNGKIANAAQKAFPNITVGALDNENTAKSELETMLLKSIDLYTSIIPKAITDPETRLAISIYASAFYGWIMAKMLDNVELRDLVNWIEGQVQEVFNHGPECLFIHKPDGFLYKIDWNANELKISETDEWKKSGQMSVRQIGLTSTSTQKEIKPNKLNDLPVIIWKISTEEGFKDAMRSSMLISKGEYLINPKCQFKISKIPEQAQTNITSISLIYIAPLAKEA